MTAPIPYTAVMFSFGAVGGVVALAGPSALYLYQNHTFECIRADVTKLRHAFEDDLGAVDDRSRKILTKKRFRYLRYELADIWEF